ncbi:MAG: glycosyltransferase family 61 protein [Alphaproteobacteria bacterium]
MARGRPEWKKKYDGETIASAIFNGLERASPRLTAGLKYHARLAPPAAPLFQSIETHALKIASPPYRDIYETVKLAQADLTDRTKDPFHAIASTWLFANPKVLGHTVRIIDRTTGALVSTEEGSRMRWSRAYAFPLPQRRVPCGPILANIPASENNYYHLVINTLLPFAHAVLRHRGELKGRRISLAVRNAPSVIVRVVDALRACGIDIEIVKLKPSEAMEAETGFHATLIHPSLHPNHGHWSGEAGEELIEALDRVVPPMHTPARVHIPRTETTVRRILNNDDYQKCIDDNGLAPMVARWDNFDLQYRTFRQAREIVAVHGAGLANLCWTRPGTRVTEITPTDARRSPFLQIGAERGVDFRFFFAGREQKKQNFDIDTVALGAHLARRD